MNTTQFTPGPWTVRATGHKFVIEARGFADQFAPVYVRLTPGHPEAAAANARLMAAAPELWATLRMTLDAFREAVGHDAWREFEQGNVAVKLAQATLSKVEGRS